MTIIKFTCFSLMLCVLIPAGASAQVPLVNENAQTAERMDRLEHDLMLLQKQVALGSNSSSTTPVTVAPTGDAAAQLEVRLSAIEEEIRNLRGKVEESNFQVKKLSDNLDKLQKDTDFRFNDLARAKPTATTETPVASATTPANGELPPVTPLERHPIAGNQVAADVAASTGETISTNIPTKTPDNDAIAGLTEGIKTSFTSPREHYNYAFRLLNQTQYDEAAKAFDAFTKQYPKDPLIGNAYYWEGETFYIRRDYVHAADDFRQGFEALPEGPKAPDNLLKLAMSLDALSRDKEACVVLKQIAVKFDKNVTNVVDKANQEQKRIGCQ